MGVLQPWLLALGLGVAVPLLLHLLQRHQGPRVVFPALRYLRRAERESARKVKLRQWLLLLLRVAAVLLVTLAAARPFLAGAGSAHEPSAVVIVLDNSLSSAAVAGERRVLDGLRERALQTLSLAGPDDRFWLLLAGSPEEPAGEGSARATAARIRRAEPAPTTADLPGALARARAILAAGAGGRTPEIHLLSDLQASGIQVVSGDDHSPPLMVWAEPAPPPTNRAVTNVDVAGGLAPLAGTRSQLTARLEGDPPDSVTLRLYLDGRLTAAAAVSPNHEAALSLPPSPAGFMRGHVEADPDGLPADDRRYFVTRVVPPPAIATRGASTFLQEALAALAAAGRLRPGGAGEADIVIVSGAQPLPLLARPTTLVVLPPTSEVELPALNRQLGTAGIPWSYGPAQTGGQTRLTNPDTVDALLRALEQARLSRSYPLQPGAGAAGDSVLLRTLAGAPWAVRGRLPGGARYVLLGSALDSASTSIPTSAAMIPLLTRVLGTWAGGGAERLEAAVGDELALPAGADHVLRPDSVAEPLSAGPYLVPPVLGIYHARAGDSVVSAFAVNAPRTESDLRRISERELAAALAGWNIRSAARAEDWRRTVFSARLGMELWRPLLLLLLALLLAEALVAATGASRRAAPAAGPEMVAGD